MADPLLTYIFDVNTPESRRYRSIENHYHLAKTARNTQQMVALQAASLQMQAQIGAQTNRNLAEIGYGIDGVSDQLSGISDQMGGVRRDVQVLQATAERTESAIGELNATVDYWLSDISQQMMAQQATLDRVADTLRRPLETQVQELLQHADQAIKSGMQASGSQRAEWYKDALELLKTAIENPVGKQNYVAWFQIGYVLWKSTDLVGDAEDAFARASRLSAPQRDTYHVLSLRHLAYMRYLQGNHAGAYDAISDALRVNDEHDTMYDAARYASLTERPDEAVGLVEACIGRQPTTVVAVASEPDFNGAREKLALLVERLLSGVRGRAASSRSGV